MKARITFSLIFITLIVAFCAVQISAEDVFEAPAWQEKVSMELRDTPDDVALKNLIESAGTKCVIENPNIKYFQIPNLSLKDVPRFQALETLVKASGLAYRVENDTIIIGLKPGSDYPWIKNVSVDVKSAKLGDVLPDLFKSAGFNFTLDQDAADLIVNSVKLTDMPFAEAFEKLLDNAGATYLNHGVIKVIPKQALENKEQSPPPQTLADIFPGVTVTRTADNEDPWLRRVDVKAKDALLRHAIDYLFRGTGMNYAIERGTAMQTVIDSLELTDVTFREALEKVLDYGDAVYRKQGGVVLIGSRSTSVTPPKIVNLEVKDMPLPQVVELLFADTGIHYEIDPDISKMRITATLANIPFDRALSSLTAATTLTYRIEKGVYRISAEKKTTADPVSGNSTPNVGPAKAGPAGNNSQPGTPRSAGLGITVKMQVTYPLKSGAVVTTREMEYPMIKTSEGEVATLSVTREIPPQSDGSKQLVGLTSISMQPDILAEDQIRITGKLDFIQDEFSARNVKILAVLKKGKPEKLPPISIPSTSRSTKATLDLTLTAVQLYTMEL